MATFGEYTLGSASSVIANVQLPYYPQLMAEEYNQWNIFKEFQAIADSFNNGYVADDAFSAQYTKVIKRLDNVSRTKIFFKRVV